MRRIIATLLVLGLGSSAAAAQVRCDPDEKPIDCWRRAEQELEPDREDLQEDIDQAADEEKAELLGKPTGVDTGGLNLATNTKNFLPLLALSALLGQDSDSDGDGVYVLDLNFLIPGLAEDKNSQIQAAVNSQPTLPDALTEALPEDQRDDLVQELEGELGDLDDYTLSFTYNWVNARHGRGFEQYRNRFASLTRAVSKDFDLASGDEDLLRAFGEFIAENEEELENVPDDLDVTFEEINTAIGEEKGDAFKSSFEAAVEQKVEELQRNRQQLADAGLGFFADLVNNQPQLYVSASQRFLAPVLGGDETSFKITYEWGQASLNHAMNRRCHEDLDTADTSGLEKRSPGTLDDCLSQFTNFVNAHKDSLKDGNRFSFSAEYLDIDEQPVDLAELGVPGLTLEGAKKVVVSAGWSRLFGQGPQGQQPLRLDFVGTYEDVSDDPLRQDRGIATLTVTRQFGGLAVPFGIVYATHGEFLPEVDKQLSAHVGLKFNLFGEQ